MRALGGNTMIYPLSALAPALRERLPSQLVSDAAFARCEVLFRALPPVFSWGCFEVRLSGNADVDFLGCVLADAHAVEATNRHVDAPWGNGLDDWARTSSFLRRWITETSLRNDVPFVWLEYDLGDARVRARPLLFACSEPAFAAEDSHPPDAPQAQSERVLRVLDALAPESRGTALQQQLGQFARRLGRGSRLLHLARVSTISGPVLRVVVALDGRTYLDELDTLGWRGPRTNLEELVGHVSDSRSHVGLHLDIVADGVLPTVSVQVFRTTSPNDDLSGWRILDHLENIGACTSSERESCGQWVGRSRHRVAGLAWPCELARGLELKITLRGTDVLAKAYLGFHASFALKPTS